jgi:glutathione S-transferase
VLAREVERDLTPVAGRVEHAVDQHDRRAAAGDAVDHAPAVELDLPLLEVRSGDADGAQRARCVALAVARSARAGSQLGTSGRTLAKGHTPDSVLRLVTIPISHYCEKARWALDRAGLDYREEPHVQGIHRIAARRAGGGATVPVLVTDEGVVADSADILTWVDARTSPERRLFPTDPVELRETQRLCQRLDDVLGPSGRRLVYVHMLALPEIALDYNNRGVPAWEDHVMRRGWPLAKTFLRAALGIRPGVEVTDEATVWRELDFVAALLDDGRPYLLGEGFGAADLTFAALAAPVLMPPIYGVPLPQPEVLPEGTAQLVRRAREHPAGAFAMRVIAQQRGAIPV